MDQGRRTRGDTLLRVLAVIAALYFAQNLVLPVALAVVLGFGISPLVDRFARWGLNRMVAVLLSVILSFGVLGAVGLVITGQIVQMAHKLPEFRDPIIARTRGMGQVGSILRESFSKLEETIGQGPGSGKEEKAGSSNGKAADSKGEGSAKGNSLEGVWNLAKQLLGALGPVLTIFVLLLLFLINRRDLGDRLFRLLKQRGMAASRATLEESGRKVSNYLYAATVINFLYGSAVVLGTWLLKVPQPLFWGFLVFLFRFIPYIGTWLVAALALVLSLALSPTWIAPAILVGFWFTLERITSDLVEPWIYKKRTGITAVGVMISAVFWSWAWGIPGLMIATPITACLVELGVEIPGLGWLNTLFSTKPSPSLAMAGGSGPPGPIVEASPGAGPSHFGAGRRGKKGRRT